MRTCLYLRNLPRRPQSKDHYIRYLLKCINRSNPYVLDCKLPLPRNETIGNRKLEMLDESNGILEISVSKTLTSQCFITFINESSAKSFQEKGLQVKGRNIDIKSARRDSLLGLSIKRPSLLDRVLRSRRRKWLSSDQLVSKRRSRRLRSNLRKKGLTETEIAHQLNIQTPRPKHGDSVMKPQQSRNVPRNVKVVTKKNPPNKILLVQSLPENCQLSEIEPIFQGNGFVEIRLVAIRRVAFVEYDSIPNATAQLNSMGDTYRFNGHTISIGFAK